MSDMMSAKKQLRGQMYVMMLCGILTESFVAKGMTRIRLLKRNY